jgi:hypothetical protein
VATPGAPNLAGSALRLDAAIGNTVRFTGLPLEEVVPMASTRPAAYVGMETAGKVTAEWDAAAFALRVLRVATMVAALALPAAARAQAPPEAPSAPVAVGGLPLEGTPAEEFLRTAKVVDRARIGGGITHPDRLTLTDGTRTHHAIWKTIDEHRMGLRQLEGGVEFDFRDSWRHEVAVYELDKLLGLRLVPPTVERRIGGQSGSLQMWVDGAMTEGSRRKSGLAAPDAEAWNAQMHRVRLFHELAYNTDYRNPENVLVDPAFRIYAVDFSRAFRIAKDLLAPDDLVRFSRAALAALAALDRPTLDARLGRWLEKSQIGALLARRDRILALAKQRVAEKGEDAVLYP